MSVLTIAIIVAVVLIPLLYKDWADHSLPDELGYVVFCGIIIDFIVIAICAGIRFGWWGFFISAIILVCIFFGIDAYTDRLRKERELEIAEREERRRELDKSVYEWSQSERYAAYAKAYGPAFGFILVGPNRYPDPNQDSFGIPKVGTGTCALFGVSPAYLVDLWKGLAVPTREYGDSNERTIHFNEKKDDTMHYHCKFKHDRLYYISETRRKVLAEYRDRYMPHSERGNYTEDNGLWAWETKYPFVDHPEESISVLEDGIQLRSKKINAVAVRKDHWQTEEKSYSKKTIHSEWEVITPDDKKIKCICEWRRQKRYDDGYVVHECSIYQEYELIE